MTDKELNEAVAEKVMGWRRLRGEDEISAVIPVPKKKEWAHFEEVWIDTGGRMMACKECGTMPNFATDIADAWRVVEKMREHSNQRSRNLRMVCYCYDRTYATFESYDDGPMVEGNGMHATPRAICSAALKTVEQAK